MPVDAAAEERLVALADGMVAERGPGGVVLDDGDVV
jgi:hypothetical protein